MVDELRLCEQPWVPRIACSGCPSWEACGVEAVHLLRLEGGVSEEELSVGTLVDVTTAERAGPLLVAAIFVPAQALGTASEILLKAGWAGYAPIRRGRVVQPQGAGVAGACQPLARPAWRGRLAHPGPRACRREKIAPEGKS